MPAATTNDRPCFPLSSFVHARAATLRYDHPELPGPAHRGAFESQSTAAHDLTHSRIERIAALDSTVMISGESGTGKTTVAREIHQLSPRAGSPFVSVNCASLPRELIEAELFGHAKGAFTGAIADRTGRAELANGGTFFLDEIGDLPLELQPKLLTFLQDHTVQKIGANKTLTVDVRVIVATHQNLPALCAARRFREDLYYRLNVFPLYVPPLRERIHELPEIAANILQRIAARRQVPGWQLQPEAMTRLTSHQWPGNIRELENVLERAAGFCQASTICADDVVIDLHETASSGRQSRLASLAGMTLAEVERRAILDTLHSCGGNKALSARTLGISEKSIYNKMRRLKIVTGGERHSRSG